jgi:CheY-like chemotaxis protein
VKDRQLLVLVVEPDRPLAALFQLDLTQRGHSVNVVHSAEHALKVLTPEYDVVVTGLRLPEMTGERFIQSMRVRPGYADLPVLVIAADMALPVSISDDATRLRRKPFNLEHFADYVAEAAGPGRFRN